MSRSTKAVWVLAAVAWGAVFYVAWMLKARH
jgi:hypothetical protein